MGHTHGYNLIGEMLPSFADKRRISTSLNGAALVKATRRPFDTRRRGHRPTGDGPARKGFR